MKLMYSITVYDEKSGQFLAMGPPYPDYSAAVDVLMALVLINPNQQYKITYSSPKRRRKARR